MIVRLETIRKQWAGTVAIRRFTDIITVYHFFAAGDPHEQFFHMASAAGLPDNNGAAALFCRTIRARQTEYGDFIRRSGAVRGGDVRAQRHGESGPDPWLLRHADLVYGTLLQPGYL